VAIPDILRTNTVTPPMTDVRDLLKVTDLLVAIQGFTGASPIVGNIKTPERGSTWLECLPDGWTPHRQNAGDAMASKTSMSSDSTCSKTVPTR